MTGRELAREIKRMLDALPAAERERVLAEAGWDRHALRSISRGHEPKATRIDALLTAMGKTLVIGNLRRRSRRNV